MTDNSEVFPLILQLYVPIGSKVADVTFGKGVFWKNVQSEDYECFFSDIKTHGLTKGCRGGMDSRNLPFEKNTFDAVVFDPPYMHTPGGTAHNGHQNFEEYYSNNNATIKGNENQEKANVDEPKYHEAVLQLYYDSAREASRILKNKGIYIVKCQDEVCSNVQRLTHIEITNKLYDYGFIPEDIFIIVRRNKPGVSRIKKQVHARKNHSYFMVFRKKVKD